MPPGSVDSSNTPKTALPPGSLGFTNYTAEIASAAALVNPSLLSIWATERLAGNHGMMADILRELGSACVVVGKDLRILHANRAAHRLFLDRADTAAPLSFAIWARKNGSRNAFAIIVPCQVPYGDTSSPVRDCIALAPGAA